MSKASDLVSQAVTTIVLDHPFFATLLLQMPRIEDPSIPTACTNGVHIRYNPKFIESLTPSEIAGLLAHEVLHPALGHLKRLPPNKFGNIAGDYAINNFLDSYNEEAGARRLDLPAGGCLDHKYDDMSCEEILADLLRNQPPPPPPPPEGKPEDGDGKGQGEGEGESEEDGDEGDGKGKGKGKGSQPDGGSGQDDPRTQDEGGWGEFEEQAGSEELSPDEMASEWERRVIQAATACKMQGKLPGCVEALLNDVLDPGIPWEQLLQRFFDQTSANDYSWRKPDRRFLPQDIIIPDLHDETLGEVVVAVDTSGSIFSDPEALASFQGAVNSLLEGSKPTKTHVIYCDAAVQGKPDESFDGAPIKITPRGGGGTDFRPVGTYIEKHNITPRVCIYLTDLFGEFPDTEWPFPTIWCVYGNPDGVAPFGDTVHIKPKKK
jgi:predicted metal-dependent peptidase